MAKLNDTQSILLSSAAQRDNGSIYPLAKTVTAGARVSAAVAALLKAGFAEEQETADLTLAYRQNGDLNFGVFATSAGLAAIGVEPNAKADDVVAAPATPRVSKRDNVVSLLSRGEGATMAELITATGWLPHTTRAALTGLRKKGHSIERSKRGTDTCYRIVAVAA